MCPQPELYKLEVNELPSQLDIQMETVPQKPELSSIMLNQTMSLQNLSMFSSSPPSKEPRVLTALDNLRLELQDIS